MIFFTRRLVNQSIFLLNKVKVIISLRIATFIHGALRALGKSHFLRADRECRKGQICAATRDLGESHFWTTNRGLSRSRFFLISRTLRLRCLFFGSKQPLDTGHSLATHRISKGKPFLKCIITVCAKSTFD